MNDRISIKQRARARLTENKWLTIGITFIAGLLGADGVSYSGNFRFNSNVSYNNTDSVFNSELFSSVFLPIFIIAAIIAIIRLAVGASAILGLNSYNIKLLRYQNPDFSDLFSKFRYFWKAIGLRIYIGFFVFLWTLLLIVPGIIAGYRYSMATYIMAENPEIGIAEAVNMSKEMMKGHKAELFVLELSFFGWAMLGLITFGILLLWVTPYINLAKADFYLCLRYSNIQPYINQINQN
jgi:uncharacterized membrane protein